MPEQYTLDTPAALSCPECGGTLRRESNGGLLQYRCHIGHRLSAETLLHAQYIRLEKQLAACLAALNERATLCREMSERAQAEGAEHHAFEAAQEESLRRAEVLRSLLESRWTLPEAEVTD